MYECVSPFSHIDSFVFFSVDLAYPELLMEEWLWELSEKKHHYINMSFDISRSLVEGNKNQRGQHAWVKVLISLFSAVMASVNQSFLYYDLKEELHNAIKHLLKSRAPEATLELVKMTEKYDNIITKLVKLGAEKIKSGNISYPKIINTEVLNNTYRIHYNYISSDITRQELGRIQEDTYTLLDPVLKGDFPDLDLAVRCHDARTFLCTVRMYSTSRVWPTCATHTKMHQCQQPKESHTPDIVLMLLPENRSESLEILAFCVEIVGSKAVWSTDSTTRSMFIGMLKS